MDNRKPKGTGPCRPFPTSSLIVQTSRALMWPSVGKDAGEPSFRPKAGDCTSLEMQDEE